jgi:hypothetical protein
MNGAVVGTNFDCTKLQPDEVASLQRAVTLARKLLQSVNATQPTTIGWTVSLDVGTYGRHYFLRAEVAQDALGANRKEDAVLRLHADRRQRHSADRAEELQDSLCIFGQRGNFLRW